MSYTLRVATPEGRDLVIAALRVAAKHRTTAATRAAGIIAAQRRTGELKDTRAASVKVTNLLAEAHDLEELATELEQAINVAVVEATPAELATITRPAALRQDLTPAEVDAAVTGAPVVEDDGTGTSAEAQRLAALAGLDDPIIEDGIDTGATAEDDPDADDVEEALR